MSESAKVNTRARKPQRQGKDAPRPEGRPKSQAKPKREQTGKTERKLSGNGRAQLPKAEAMVASTVPVAGQIPLLSPAQGFGGEAMTRAVSSWWDGVQNTLGLSTTSRNNDVSKEELSDSQQVKLAFSDALERIERAKKHLKVNGSFQARSLHLAQALLGDSATAAAPESRLSSDIPRHKETFRKLSEFMTQLFVSSEKAGLPFSKWDEFQMAVQGDIPIAPQAIPLEAGQLNRTFAPDYKMLTGPYGSFDDLIRVNFNHPFYDDGYAEDRPYVYVSLPDLFRTGPTRLGKVRSNNARLIGLGLEQEVIDRTLALNLLYREADWLSGKAKASIEQDSSLFDIYRMLTSHPSLSHIPLFQTPALSRTGVSDAEKQHGPYGNVF